MSIAQRVLRLLRAPARHRRRHPGHHSGPRATMTDRSSPMDESSSSTPLKAPSTSDERRYPRLSDEQKARLVEDVKRYLEADAALRAFLSGADAPRLPKLVQ